MTEDRTLLQRYTSQGSREALDELIRRHLDLIYSSALRQVRDLHLAEDVTQAVFLILAQKARKIREGVAVAGWLLAVTRTTAVDAMRKRTLDRRYEEANAKPELAPAAEASWAEIAPMLDAALSRLPERDRDAIVLRVLENQSLAQVGAELGVSQDAAAKRIDRALARLRNLLKGVGVSTGAIALTATLSTHAVHAAPAHFLAVTLSGRVSAAVTALAQGALRARARATAKLVAAIALVILAALGGTAFNPGVVSPSSISPSAPPSAATVQRLTAAPVAFDSAGLPPFQIVDDFQQAANLDAIPYVIVSDSAGNMYASGWIQNRPGPQHGLIREKLAGSATWTTIFHSPSTRAFKGICILPSGDLYAAGDSNNKEWVIFKRPAGQTDFLSTPVDLIANGVATRMVINAAGDTFVTGSINGRWVVRKQSSGTTNFITVDDYLPWMASDVLAVNFGGGPNAGADVTIVNGHGPSAGIYVAGTVLQASSLTSVGQPHWIVRKSADGGNSWMTVDDYIQDSVSTAGSAASTLTSDKEGNLYVVGYGADMANYAHWIVRKSSTGNLDSWTVDDDFQYLLPSQRRPHVDSKDPAVASLVENQAIGVGVDPAGIVYAVGMARDADNVAHQILRSNAGGRWNAVDDFQFMMAGNAWGNGFAADPGGNLYIVGRAQDASSKFHWIVRSAMPAFAKLP